MYKTIGNLSKEQWLRPLKDVNLTTLQRYDSRAVEILHISTSVAVYNFNQKIPKWEKTDIAGTLFVYTRSEAPVNCFMIINRLHRQDLMEPINKNLEFQLQDPFLLYKDSRNESICGIWFYDRNEFSRIGQLMNTLCLVQVARKARDEEQSRQRRASGSESDTSVKMQS